MAKRCQLTGVGAQFGNNVSHSKRRTRRRFLPNLQNVSLRSDILESDVSLRVTAATIRTIDHNGGLDEYLLKTSNLKLPDQAKKVKRKVQKAMKVKGIERPFEPKRKDDPRRKAPSARALAKAKKSGKSSPKTGEKKSKKVSEKKTDAA